MPRVFCIDGVVIDIPKSRVTKEELKHGALIPIEDQPIMAGVLSGQNIDLLSPEMSHDAADRLDGMMLEDINTETFGDVSRALKERGDVASDASEEWP